MSTEDKLKICVECRVMVPDDAAECPECGYPFDNTGVLRCAACSSVIVNDVENCPVCGHEVQPLMESAVPVTPYAAPPEQPTAEEMFSLSEHIAIAPATQQEEQVVSADYSGVMSRLDTINYALHELASAIQSNNKINDNIIRMVRENSQDVRNTISENQAANQRFLQETMNTIKAVYELVRAGSDAASKAEITDVKAAIADVAEQQTTSASLVIAAIKENAAKPVSSPVIELPPSLKWLDYMFVAIIVALIFSMGNLLVMAYVARMIMALE